MQLFLPWTDTRVGKNKQRRGRYKSIYKSVSSIFFLVFFYWTAPLMNTVSCMAFMAGFSSDVRAGIVSRGGNEPSGGNRRSFAYERAVCL